MRAKPTFADLQRRFQAAKASRQSTAIIEREMRLFVMKQIKAELRDEKKRKAS